MSRWNSPNNNWPTWAVVLLDERPACFSDESWAEYLTAVHGVAMADPALRKRLERGGMPEYCADCTQAHRQAMERDSSCWPLKGFERVQES